MRPLFSLTLPPYLLFLLFSSLVSGARNQPTSFCKCICFNNSTIIPLNSPPSTSPSSDASSHIKANLNFHLLSPYHAHPPPSERDGDVLPRQDESDQVSQQQQQYHRLTCADCNRAFCRSYNLPICHGATDSDIFTSCFQRDSLKDELVVVTFLVATSGLLGWALVKPWVIKVWDRSGLRGAGGSGGLNLPRPVGGGGVGGGRRNNRRDGTTAVAAAAAAAQSGSGSAGRYEQLSSRPDDPGR